MARETILSQIRHHAATRPGDAAIVAPEGDLSWAELARRMEAGAAMLAARGAGPGERVALLAANGPEAILGYLAAVASGACAVPMPISLRAEGLAGLLADCAPCVILADTTGAALLDEIGTPPAPVLDLTPELFAGEGGAPLDPPEDAPFNIIYSSGTTGRPKGIVHSHAMRDGQACRRHFELGPESRMLLSTPIYSNTTLVPMLAALFHGGAVQLMRKFDAGAFLALAASWRATHTMLVPVQYQRIMDRPDFDSFDLSSMKVKQSTSARFDADLKADVLARFPGRMVEVYGLTEGGVSTVLDASAWPDRLDTVGKPGAGVELKVIDSEDNELPQGETGELIGHSPLMMQGYWGQPELTEAFLWRHPDGRIFFRSGDLGRIDAEGWVHIVGRRKEMINSGGFNIYPVDLEAALASHPAVAEVAVFAIPSRKWGETPFAAVVLKPGAEATEADLLDWANSRLGRMQKIDGLALRPDLPRSSIGKVAKAELAAEYSERAST